jgi:hypothetical protein
MTQKPVKAILIETTAISEDLIRRIAYAQYGEEPCRFCGALTTFDDMQGDRLVFAGRDSQGHFRIAHKTCFEERSMDNPSTWAHP